MIIGRLSRDARQRIAEALADDLRRKHPGAVVTVELDDDPILETKGEAASSLPDDWQRRAHDAAEGR